MQALLRKLVWHLWWHYLQRKKQQCLFAQCRWTEKRQTGYDIKWNSYEEWLPGTWAPSELMSSPQCVLSLRSMVLISTIQFRLGLCVILLFVCHVRQLSELLRLRWEVLGSAQVHIGSMYWVSGSDRVFQQVLQLQPLLQINYAILNLLLTLL